MMTENIKLPVLVQFYDRQQQIQSANIDSIPLCLDYSEIYRKNSTLSRILWYTIGKRTESESVAYHCERICPLFTADQAHICVFRDVTLYTSRFQQPNRWAESGPHTCCSWMYRMLQHTACCGALETVNTGSNTDWRTFVSIRLNVDSLVYPSSLEFSRRW